MHAPGKWYISVVCEHCTRRLILFPDLTEGKSDLKQSRITITCPDCRNEGSYLAEHYLESKRPSGELTTASAEA